MIRTSLWMALVCGLAIACGGSTAGDGGGLQMCVHDGKTYAIGETYDVDCNTCQCTTEGFACTAMACAQPGCVHDGQTYSFGESFPAGDGCNSCTCNTDGSVGCTLMDCTTGCFHNGQVYQPGQSFPAGDGCNTCVCAPDGTVSCTEADCAKICTYGGKEYGPGEDFPALDGCNKCECLGDGSVSCTEINCPCDPAKEWWRDYVAEDPQTCAVIDYACPENTVAFSNACGCGCEQDASCPQYFDCMPPAGCNVPDLKKKCPYSGIAY